MPDERASGEVRPAAARRLPAIQSLSGRLILFGTLLTLASVVACVLALSFVVRRQARANLVALLAQNQSNARDRQERSLQELLWISTLVSESPTLRAAMDTYRSESTARGTPRLDLLATVAAEVRKIRELVGKDVVIVTDEEGVVLASDPVLDPRVAAGSDLKDRTWMRGVLDATGPVVRPVFGVMVLSKERVHVGCVPVLLQGYVIGTLTLGERMDGRWLASLASALNSDAALILDGATAASTVAHAAIDPALLGRLSEPSGAGPAELTQIAGEEFLTVPVPLGEDDRGRAATLLLLRSLTRALQPAQRSMLLALLSCGALTAALAGAAAWRVSRSILSPFERFVAFIRAVATSRDASRRFEDRATTTEIRVLNDAFTELLASVQEHERQLVQRQKEELARVERLKESEKLASLGRMLSGAAHEINNPLTAVLGHVELSLGSDRLDDTLRRRLDGARKEAHRISALVRNLLKVAHRDTGERTLVDLHQLLNETIALRQHDFTAAGIGLCLVPCEDAILMEASELELQQVFLNIINNALDALKGMPGGPALTVRTMAAAGSATVTLEDNGPGMKDPRKVFDHFYTTKEIGKGTGLGLSITHAIVQNHGGSIAAHNRPEGGACFTVTLPAGGSRRASGLPAAAAADSPAEPPVPKTVLVVEDEPAVLEYQMDILRSLGAAPVGAASADEAILWFGRRDFDAVVSDLKMPGGMSGADLYAWARINRPALAARFVFVTGDTASEATRQFLEKAQRPYLMKPFKLEDYIRALRQSQVSPVLA